jgi:hypothetical protein
MTRNERIEEIVSRCRLACGQEATAYDLSEEVGYFLHDLAVNELVYSNQEKPVLNRTIQYTIRDFFELSNKDNTQLPKLYKEIYKKMDTYGALIRKAKEE